MHADPGGLRPRRGPGGNLADNRHVALQLGPAPDNPEAWAAAIADSYRVEMGEPLADPEELMDLPAVVLCHDTSADPVFVYANRAAQRLWRRTWQEFIGMPSRLTAPPQERAARARALAGGEVVRGYSGVRVTADGQRFTIAGAVVWPVTVPVDGSRIRVGQAATFGEWAEPAGS